MSLVTLAQAKAHLRVEESGEDALIQSHIEAAETVAFHYLNRNVYADQSALTTAISGTAAALSAATAAYITAVESAATISSDVEAGIALDAADMTYQAAQQNAKRTYAGIVLNDAIKSAILLLVGHLYLNREAGTDKAISEIPFGVYALLQPFRVY